MGSGTLTPTGTLKSTPNTTFNVDFYSSPTADPSGYGEGQTYSGSTSVTTDLGGNAYFTAVLSAVTFAPGSCISATVTDPHGNTSEFSQNATTTLVLLKTSEFRLSGPGGDPTSTSNWRTRPATHSQLVLSALAAATEGLTGADLNRLCEDGKLLLAYDKSKRRPERVATEYFLHAINTVKTNKERYATIEAATRRQKRASKQLGSAYLIEFAHQRQHDEQVLLAHGAS